MTPSPCYNPKTKIDCPDRSAGCSATCPKWAKYVEERNKVYAERMVTSRAFNDNSAVAQNRRIKYFKSVIANRANNNYKH